MVRSVLWAIALLVTLTESPAVFAKRNSPPSAGQVIIVYTGSVDAQSADRLTTMISDNADKIIGLKLTVTKSADGEGHYYSSLDDNRLNIASGDPLDAPTEVVINDGIGTTAAGAFYTVDGFYLIKSGGSHAGGAISFGAMPVSEATIRLNPRIRLVTKFF